MVRYRRNRVDGGTYFFTVTLADRPSTTLIVLPRLNAAFAQSNVLSAKARVMSMYSTARATAVSRGVRSISYR